MLLPWLCGAVALYGLHRVGVGWSGGVGTHGGARASIAWVCLPGPVNETRGVAPAVRVYGKKIITKEQGPRAGGTCPILDSSLNM